MCFSGKQDSAHATHGGVQLKRATTYPEDYVDTFVSRFPDVQVHAGCLLISGRASAMQ